MMLQVCYKRFCNRDDDKMMCSMWCWYRDTVTCCSSGSDTTGLQMFLQQRDAATMALTLPRRPPTTMGRGVISEFKVAKVAISLRSIEEISKLEKQISE